MSMEVETRSSAFGKPIITGNVEQVVVKDKYGNPIMVAVHYGRGSYGAFKIGDSDFSSVLRNLNIKDVVSVEDYNPTVGTPPEQAKLISGPGITT